MAMIRYNVDASGAIDGGAEKVLEQLWRELRPAPVVIDSAYSVYDGGVTTRVIEIRQSGRLTDKQINEAAHVKLDGAEYLQLVAEGSHLVEVERDRGIGDLGFFQMRSVSHNAFVTTLQEAAKGLAEVTKRKITWLGKPVILVPLNDPDRNSPRCIYRVPARTVAEAETEAGGFWCSDPSIANKRDVA